MGTGGADVPVDVPVDVLIVDRRALQRLGIRRLLDAQAAVRVVGDAASLAEAARDAGRSRPDVVLLHLDAPADAAGLRAVTRPALVATSFPPGDLTLALLAAGARGVLDRPALPQVLTGLRAVAAGGAALSPGPAAQLVRACFHGPDAPGAAPARAGTPPLTAREREVLALLVRGRSNREMAHALHLSVPTVKAHVQHVLTKLGARNRIEAIGLAHAAGAAGRRPGVERDTSAVQAGVATMRAGGRAPVSVPEGQAAGTTVRDAVQP